METKYQELTSFIKEKFPNQDFIPLHAPSFLGNEKNTLQMP